MVFLYFVGIVALGIITLIFSFLFFASLAGPFISEGTESFGDKIGRSLLGLALTGTVIYFAVRGILELWPMLW